MKRNGSCIEVPEIGSLSAADGVAAWIIYRVGEPQKMAGEAAACLRRQANAVFTVDPLSIFISVRSILSRKRMIWFQ